MSKRQPTVKHLWRSGDYVYCGLLRRNVAEWAHVDALHLTPDSYCDTCMRVSSAERQRKPTHLWGARPPGWFCPECTELRCPECAELRTWTIKPEVATTPAPTEGAVKHDDDKPRYDLLPWDALEVVAQVMGHGAKKYAAHNYRKGMAWARLARAAIGHIAKWLMGHDLDDEADAKGNPGSGLPHLAHAGASVLMLLSLVLLRVGTDDRFKKESKP